MRSAGRARIAEIAALDDRPLDQTGVRDLQVQEFVTKNTRAGRLDSAPTDY